MTKEELKKEAERFVSENSMKQALVKFTEQRKVRTEIEINGVRFSSISDMLQYMDKQRDHIINLEEENAELEKKISILLSCKNCPDNKGGYICQKEYEGKCLSQKIKFIKELQEENAELKAYNEKLLDGDIEKHNKIVELEEENSRLKQIILGNEMEIAAKDETIEDLFETNQRLKIELDTPVYDKLDKAKELTKRMGELADRIGLNYSLQVKVEAEKFLKECE